LVTLTNHQLLLIFIDHPQYEIELESIKIRFIKNKDITFLSIYLQRIRKLLLYAKNQDLYNAYV